MRYIPEETLREICSEINGEFGLYISIPEENEKLMINGHKKFNSASTIKIPPFSRLDLGKSPTYNEIDLPCKSVKFVCDE